MAGLVFLLVFRVLAGACQRHAVGVFLAQLTITNQAQEQSPGGPLAAGHP
jgi:hypothetical protein